MEPRPGRPRAGVVPRWPRRSRRPRTCPKAIHGGLDAATCQFPSAVAMLDQASESLFCTGSLVHPQVVLLAAHCIDPNYSWATPGYAAFGEHADAPAFKVPVERCGFHPKWMNQDFDLAACVLAEPVDGVPIVPLLMGCEADQLAPGSEVTIVGFGADHAVYEGGEVIAEGAGPKRYTTQIVTELLPEWLDILMVGQGAAAASATPAGRRCSSSPTAPGGCSARPRRSTPTPRRTTSSATTARSTTCTGRRSPGSSGTRRPTSPPATRATGAGTRVQGAAPSRSPPRSRRAAGASSARPRISGG
ncbi:MAG: trypsin-like serine protease [Myxococcales bacterium]|nr:trypsin-like serine protease [Myxococcales bacterium]